MAQASPDSATRAQLALAAEEIRQTVAAKDSEVTFWKAQAAAWRALSLAKDSAIAQINASLGEAIRERDQWRARATPGPFKRLLQSVPYVVGYAVLQRAHVLP